MKDWDLVYRQEQPPIWNIGAVQPALAALIDEAGSVRGDVLDAGCGYAELSLELAARGRTVVGIDVAPTALKVAMAAADERRLSSAMFVQDDVTSFTGYDGQFSTIFDSGMPHSLPPHFRQARICCPRPSPKINCASWFRNTGSSKTSDPCSCTRPPLNCPATR